MKRQGSGSKADLKGGKLTDLDRKNMEYMVKLFKSCPFTFHMKDGTVKTWTGKQWLNFVLKESHSQTENTARQKSFKTKEYDVERVLSLPPPLMTMLKESYPALISDPVQFNTFLRWFPEFRL